MSHFTQLKFYFLLLFILIPLSLFADSKKQLGEILIDDFSKTKAVGDFPLWWKTYPFQMGKAKQVYKIAEEKGFRYVHAVDDQEISIPIYKDFPWSVQEYPKMKWKWRALTLPIGAREESRATNDSACGVYVTFGGMSSGSVIKYVWSSTLPVGHVWEKEPNKFYVVVLESGNKSLNRWEKEEVNVYEDYKKYFKKEPSKDPSGLGILTDGNATHSKSACDYADFYLLKNS